MKKYITPDIDIWKSFKYFCLQTLCKHCTNHICVSQHFDCPVLLETVNEVDRLNKEYRNNIDVEFEKESKKYLVYVSQLPW